MLHTILIHAHSGLRWLVLISLVYAIVSHWLAANKKRPYQGADRLAVVIAVALVHLQLVIGFILFFINWGSKVDFSQMKNAVIRFYSVEHSFLMILAVVLITIASARARRQSSDQRRFRTIWVGFFVALILILVGIPWPFRSHLGAGWF